MAGTADLFALIRADWRRLVAWLLGGWSIFALVLLMALGYLGCQGCPPGTVSRFLSMKVLLFCLVYAMGPWVFSVHDVHHGTELLARMPLSRRDINRFMLLRGILLGLACLPMWVLVFRVLPLFGMAIHPWMAVSAGLGVLAYQLFGMMANLFVRVAVFALFPLLIFPPYGPGLLAGPLNFANSPVSAVLLAVLITVALPRVLNRPLPAAGRRR